MACELVDVVGIAPSRAMIGTGKKGRNECETDRRKVVDWGLRGRQQPQSNVPTPIAGRQ